MKIRKCFFFPMLFVAACTRPASPVQWQYSGGDSKKGIVYLSYNHAEYQDLRAGEAKPFMMANKRCRQLGFAKAARVQGERSECLRTGGLIGTCSVTRTTYEYLCGEYPSVRVGSGGKNRGSL